MNTEDTRTVSNEGGDIHRYLSRKAEKKSSDAFGPENSNDGGNGHVVSVGGLRQESDDSSHTRTCKVRPCSRLCFWPEKQLHRRDC